jgi:hypothetical protein
MKTATGLALFFPLMLAQIDGHAQIFMCKDATGHTLTSDRPIPECADRAMRELDRGGIVRREIAAPLTAAQKQQQKEADEKRKLEQAAVEAQKSEDRAIRLRYRSERDIELARKRSLDPVQDQVQREKAALATVQAQQQQAQTEADRYQKKNVAPPLAVKRRLEAADHALANSQKVIEDGEVEIAQINARFDSTLQRYRELAGRTASK